MIAPLPEFATCMTPTECCDGTLHQVGKLILCAHHRKQMGQLGVKTFLAITKTSRR